MVLQLGLQDYEACLQRGGASDKIHTMLLSLKQPCFQSDKILQMDSSLATFEQRALAPSAFRWAHCSRLFPHDVCHLHLQHTSLRLSRVKLTCRKLSRQFHPDKVPAQQKHIACVVFNYLKQAASNFW